MELFYDERDDKMHEARGSQILYWLDDLGARPLSEAGADEAGFLFTGARPIADYRKLVAGLPLINDRPDVRAPLLGLDTILDALAGSEVPTPRTWRLPLDAPPPKDLTFPLFLRTTTSSFKLGGEVSRVRNVKQLKSESEALRRALGWEALILAREWHNFAPAGTGIYGAIPQEVRVWIVDARPIAWSFHYMNVLPAPEGLPPSEEDLRQISDLASRVGKRFRSRCVVADFAREVKGGWTFIEAGPGSCAGTAHEAVFKAVAATLQGVRVPVYSDAVGGVLA